MSSYIETLSPAQREVLDRSPLSRFFFSLPRYDVLDENPHFIVVVQELDRNLTEQVGPDWQELGLQKARQFNNSSDELQEEWIINLLMMGFELGKDVDLFVGDIRKRMQNMDLDTHRGHDFVAAVLRIGANFRQEPTDWRDYPLIEIP